MLEINRAISVAPMMEYTDQHFRYLIRCISKHTLLFTEMVTSAAITHGNHKKLLSFNPIENPIALQIGGRDVKEVLSAALIAQDYGYDEINLNVGCPSKAVQKGGFGACLMLEKEMVSELIDVLSNNLKLPVSIKCRLGIDNYDSYEFLYDFVKEVSSAGCKLFYIHARKALLDGISPRDNRKIPILEYDKVRRLKTDFPELTIILNGGINSLDSYEVIKGCLDGVMIGRAAYKEPYLLAKADSKIYSSTKPADSIISIAYLYLDYVRKQCSKKPF
ncbi:MAG: tRNA dihydrouridine(20/20a) synthase DusA, partial [Legionellales bacterium]|nr:tRNA dihydrouridine(20/20a) synthase DusA [Legionellales bacterium]